MNRRKKHFFLGMGLVLFSSVILVISILVFFQEEALAVPIFARKYNTSCMTCHVGFPKLNAFGEAFKTNGYRLPNDEVFVKEPAVELGSEAYKRVWPNAVWPNSIPGSVPLSLRIVGQANFDQSKTIAAGKSKNELEFPHEMTLLSMGTLGDNLAFNLGFAIQDEEERSVVERVWLEYSDVLAGQFGIPKDLINLRIGYIEPMAMPFSAENQNLFTERAAIYDFRVSSTKQPKIRDSQTGIEMFGVVNKRLRYATGVLNGVARSGATEAFTDNNNNKDAYVRAEYKFGGLSFSGNADSGTGDKLSSGFSYFDQGPSLTLGTAEYYGVNQISAAANTTSEYYRVTGFLRANKGRYNMDVVYLNQLDNNDVGQINSTLGKNIRSWGFYTEGTAFIYPWLAFAARYDRLNIGHVSVLGAANPTDNRSRLTLSMPIYARQNLRIVPEASFGLSAAKDGDTSDNYKVRVDFAY